MVVRKIRNNPNSTVFAQLKQWLLGKSLPNSAYSHQRLSNTAGLAVLSSDALSSVAYATEEILHVLILGGTGIFLLSLPIALAIILLLGIVTLSYRQTLRAYPHGGGAYTVAKENLGLYPGLVAAAALIVDYILTVTVSIAAGTAALTSAIPSLQPLTVPLCLLFVLLLMVANLRGLKESGSLFMVPTYVFVVSIFGLVVAGLVRHFMGYSPPAYPVVPTQESLGLFLILRAFSAGCTAMTGVEAISNGVMVFKAPEWKNARLVMLAMSSILGVMFLGITYLAQVYHVVPHDKETVLSILSRDIFGTSFAYYFIQVSTLLILILAANTSYSDFPRLSSLLAKDGFMPRQLAHLGDRLVFSNGILLLSVLSSIPLIILQGSVNSIIPLYAVGVFTSFTLSQLGMVRHWQIERSRGWQTSAVINGVGSVATFLVSITILATKFMAGAWVVAISIPVVVYLFSSIHRHYCYVAKRLSLAGVSLPTRSFVEPVLPENVTHPAIVLVGQIHRGTIEALEYARTVADEVMAIHIDTGSTKRDLLQQQWHEFEGDIPLIILDSPYRSVITPLIDFVDEYETKHHSAFITIVIPSFVPKHWWENILHNQTTYFIKAALYNNQSRIITTVRYYL
jgi:amino acid transporter